MTDNIELEKLKYPIGQFQHEGEITRPFVDAWIKQIENLPAKLKLAVEGLTDEQLDTPYRAGGWTCRQVVHHIGDSHLNSIIRFKWALTEDEPTIKAYNEVEWAKLEDYKLFSLSDSIEFISYLHKKLVVLLRSLNDEQLERIFIHPETGEKVILKKNIGIYAWHGNHHVMHISSLRQRMGW